MNIKKSYIKLMSLFAVILLTACGGEGSSTPSTVDFKDISYQIPKGINVANSKAGKESKLLIVDGNESVAGFFKTEDTQINKKHSNEKSKNFGEKLYSKINSSSVNFGTLSLLSSQKITLPHLYTISHYKVPNLNPKCNFSI